MIDARIEPDTRWSPTAIAELESVCREAGADTARDEPLGRHTSMGVGGPTPLMVWPQRPEAVADTVQWCARRGLLWRVLGGGTNILVPDAGVAEPVISLTRLTEGARVTAPEAIFPAGTPTAQALRETLRVGLRGLVWTTGLPGTLGGAAAGNAGCWGGSMGDVVTRIEAIDRNGAWHTLTTADLRWAYRASPLPTRLGEGAIIVSISVSLRPDDPEPMRARSEEFQRIKRERQPIGARNAGCIFKNPDPEHPAGLLIDNADCKGLRVGNAQISELHGNFLINHGGATAAEVDELIRTVTNIVRAQSGLTLHEEIHRW